MDLFHDVDIKIICLLRIRWASGLQRVDPPLGVVSVIYLYVF